MVSWPGTLLVSSVKDEKRESRNVSYQKVPHLQVTLNDRGSDVVDAL